jgi:DNA primase catalytic core
MKTYNLQAEKTAAPLWGPLVSKIKARVSIEQVADTLGIVKKFRMRKIGASLQGDCPTGHPSENHQCFSIDTADQFYHCFSCSETGDIISLVELIQHVSFMEAVKWLIDTFTQDLTAEAEEVLNQMTPEQKEFFERGKLYRAIFEEGKKQLSTPVAQPVMDYLTKERGYDAALIPMTEFIYWDDEAKIRASLTAKYPAMKQEIQQLTLNGAGGDLFRLAIPFRDRNGVITGFLKRAHIPKGFQIGAKQDVRWDSTPGLRKTDLFGLNRIRKQTELIVVEGYPDATYLPAVGLQNVVAVGMAAFSEKYIDGLLAKGVNRLILALDNDKNGDTGIRNSEEICRLFAGTDISVFVIDPPAMGFHKDPDEYVKALGVDAFKQLVQDAASASNWMTRRILSKHAVRTDLGRERAIREGLEFADSLGNPREAEAVLNVLSATLNLTDEMLAKEYALLQGIKADERLKNGIKGVSRQAEILISNGDAEKAVRQIQSDISELQSEYWRTKEPVQMKLTEFMEQKRNRDSQRTAGQRIGFELRDFAEIDAELLGLQTGLYVIAADPNIGKTAFVVSMAIDVLKSNDHASVLFYTMDDSREMIINRFLSHLSDMKINEVRFRLTDPQKITTLDLAYDQLKIWADAGRLEIRESSEGLTMRRMHDEIRQYPNRDNLVVFIDGLYNVPVESEGENIRVENIERANQVKQIVRSFHLPVLATAEFRKQGREETANKQKERTIHDIMETGKYGYNADLIILLSPKDRQQFGQQDEPIIVADFGKNKLESFRGKMEFKFIRAKSVMTFVAGTKTQP